MKDFSLIRELESFVSDNSEEQQFCDQMLQLVRNEKRCFYRNCFPAHFTGSALIIDPDTQSVLLNHHRILNKWLQFGGHCDGNENVLEVAYREVVEESGITSLQHHPSIMDLDIHEIPENPKRNEPAHFHYDVRFVFLANTEEKFQLSHESHELKWFFFKETFKLNLDKNLIRLLNKYFLIF